MKAALALALLAALGLLAYVRLAPSDAARWHVDPLLVTMPPRPNAFLLLPGTGSGAGPGTAGAGPGTEPAPEYDVDAATLARAFDAFALAQPRVRRLAVSEGGLLATYVIRSRWVGYPDYLSLRFLPRPGGGARLAAFSRARFGRSDLGVNRARLRAWLAAFRP